MSLFKLFLYFFLFFPSFLFSSPNVYTIDQSKIFPNPLKTEGYFQVYNFSFTDNKNFITITFALTNLGPGNLNNGIATFITNSKSPDQLYTDHFTKGNLVLDKTKMYLKLNQNSIKYRHGYYEIYTQYKNISFFMKLKDRKKSYTLSGGKYKIQKNTQSFLQADSMTQFTDAEVIITQNQKKTHLKGRGTMEHFLTNEKVYNFSKEWEIHRAITKEGYIVLSGGFEGTKSYLSIKTMVILNKEGKILISRRLKKPKSLLSKKDNFSDKNFNLQEEYKLSDNHCYVRVHKKDNLGKADILKNVPVIIRTIIKVFLTKPIQVNYSSSVNIDCPELFQNILNAEGTGTIYYMN